MLPLPLPLPDPLLAPRLAGRDSQALGVDLRCQNAAARWALASSTMEAYGRPAADPFDHLERRSALPHIGGTLCLEAVRRPARGA